MAWIYTAAGDRNFMQDPNTYRGEGISKSGDQFTDNLSDLGTDELIRQATKNKLAGNENAFNYWTDYLKEDRNFNPVNMNEEIKNAAYNALLSETGPNGSPSKETIQNVFRVLGEQGYTPEQIGAQYKTNMENYYAGERERASRHHTGFSGFLEKAMPGIALGIVTGGIGSGLGLLGGSALGTGVGSEIGALAADAAIQAGLGAGATEAGLGAGTSLSADAATNPLNPFYSTANPTSAANLNTVSNLVGGGSEFNLGALNSLASNPLLPVTGAGIGGAELGATGSIIGSGDGLGVKTLPDVLRETGLNSLTPVDLSSQLNFNSSTPSTTNAKDIADALRRANQVRKLIGSTSRQPITNMQSGFNTLNAQGINQGTGLPAEYRAKNPFDFGQQQPIQDQLASLLRNNYGN
jgi:hypothetical protein